MTGFRSNQGSSKHLQSTPVRECVYAPGKLPLPACRSSISDSNLKLSISNSKTKGNMRVAIRVLTVAERVGILMVGRFINWKCLFCIDGSNSILKRYSPSCSNKKRLSEPAISNCSLLFCNSQKSIARMRLTMPRVSAESNGLGDFSTPLRWRGQVGAGRAVRFGCRIGPASQAALRFPAA